MNLFFFFCDQKLIVWISFFKGCQQKIDGFGLGSLSIDPIYRDIIIFSIRDRWARMEIKIAGDYFYRKRSFSRSPRTNQGKRL